MNIDVLGVKSQIALPAPEWSALYARSGCNLF
jgi:hypothetical protein